MINRVPAKNWTFLGVGGSPIYNIYPQNEEDLKTFLKTKPNTLKYRTLGAGSNILIRDKGYNGVFVRLHKGFNQIFLENNQLIIEAGVPSSKIFKFCVENEIEGLEFIGTIPGQAGGLAKMNAGISKIEMKDVIQWVEFFDKNGIKHILNNTECHFAYRTSIFSSEDIISRIGIKASKGQKASIIKTMHELRTYRQLTQPTIGKMAGCCFKNLTHIKAWQLINKTKIIGFGGTKISTKHKNFIVANDSTNATEIENLINILRGKVLMSHNQLLELEIEIIGNE